MATKIFLFCNKTDYKRRASGTIPDKQRVCIDTMLANYNYTDMIHGLGEENYGV